jgi:hypothetical protein
VNVIKFKTPVTETVFEYGSLFVSILAFFLCGFELLRALGLYRAGDAINIPQTNG